MASSEWRIVGVAISHDGKGSEWRIANGRGKHQFALKIHQSLITSRQLLPFHQSPITSR
jgi:hypothetical protein